FDIGGGSTELIWVAVKPGGCDILAWTSLPHGVVTLAEKFGGCDVTPESYAAMVAEVELYLQPFDAAHGLKEQLRTNRVQMIGTSGTVTTVAGIHLGLPRYDRRQVDGMWIKREDVHNVSHQLATMSYAERVAQPCIGKERADLVVAGCAIYEAISNMWPCEKLRVADRGLREGVLLDLMAEADRDVRTGA
ncbi:MAG: Ppx/GppA family phosphatase, partial [Proteobacteria bacterium]|nr:Ppx/GppA family phosphatase [Pseudomonadota bacterium]